MPVPGLKYRIPDFMSLSPCNPWAHDNDNNKDEIVKSSIRLAHTYDRKSTCIVSFYSHNNLMGLGKIIMPS